MMSHFHKEQTIFLGDVKSHYLVLMFFTLAYALNIITLYYLNVSDAWIYEVC